jgi:hypothetical protein
MPSSCEIEISTKKLRIYNSLDMIKFQQNCSKQEVVHYILKSINLIIVFRIRKSFQSSGRNLLLYLFIKTGDKTGCSNYLGISLLTTSYKSLSNILLSWLMSYIDKIIGITSVDFDVIYQLLIICSAFIEYWRKNGSTMRLYISCL